MLGNAIGYEREGDTLIVRLPYAKKGWFRRKFKTAKWNPERRAWVLHKNLRKKLDAAIIEDKNGNIKPAKTSSSRRRIDGLAAMLDAYVVYLDQMENYKAMI